MKKDRTLKPTKDPEIKIDLSSGTYYFRGTPKRGGKDIKASLGVRTFGAAVLAKKDLLVRLRGIDPNSKDILFRDYVKVFLEERKRKAPATYEQAFYSVQELLHFFDNHTMNQVNETTWDEYKIYQAQIKPGRILRYDRRQLRMMMIRLKAKGVVREVPELEYDDEGAKRKRVLTKEEIKLIFDNATGTLYGLSLFMYLMGCRPTEALGASWAEFDLERGIWSLPAKRTKTRQARAMKVNETVLTWLLSRKAESSSQWVFPSKDSHGATPVRLYNKTWKRLIATCGLSPEITSYYLRHTFLTECAKKVRDGKLSLVLITKYAGTSIEQFEKTYLHIEGEDTKEVSQLMVLDL